jgi:hypothetical protein
MHGHARFAELSGAGQAELKRGLCAFSFRNPTIGYAQSMSTVLASLLLHFSSEEHAFFTFDALLMHVLPADYYSPSMLGVKTDCAVLAALVKKRLPKLHSHLHRHRVDVSLVALPWFLCLFVHALPLHAAMRVWDVLFLKGSHVLLSVALAILAKHEDSLCMCKDTTDLLQSMQSMAKNEYDVDTLMSQALATNKWHVRAALAQDMRQEARKELEEEWIKHTVFIKK